VNQLIVGLWGPVGVGKDSVADALGWPKASFASTLKSDLAPIFERLGIDITNREQKEKVRGLMVSLGSTARSIEPTHWIRRVTIPAGSRVVFCDVRYWNEILAVVLRGGVVYELTRPGFEAANDEERRSFAEIRAKCAELGVTIPTIQNTTPREAADAIVDDLERRENVFTKALYLE
jgi:hypothetical protein